MPGDRLALAVGVGRENETVGRFHRIGDVLHPLGGSAVDLPGHLEVFVGANRSVLGRQVTHVAERGKHLVAWAQVLVDRLGLGRRFHHYNIHRHSLKQLVWRPCAPIRRHDMDRDSGAVKGFDRK